MSENSPGSADAPLTGGSGLGSDAADQGGTAGQQARTDMVAKLRHQLESVTEEFQKGAGAIKDPARRRELTVSYIEMLQKYLARAQEGLDRYKEKHANDEQTGARE